MTLIELVTSNSNKLYQLFEFLDRCKGPSKAGYTTKNSAKQGYDVIEWVITGKDLYGYIIDKDGMVVETKFRFDGTNMDNAFLYFKTNNSIFTNKKNIIDKLPACLVFSVDTQEKTLCISKIRDNIIFDITYAIHTFSETDTSLPLSADYLKHISNSVITLNIEDILKLSKNFKNYTSVSTTFIKPDIVRLSPCPEIIINIVSGKKFEENIEAVIPTYIFEPWKKSIMLSSDTVELSIRENRLFLFYGDENYSIKINATLF
jgi:hypothetical protein